MKIIRNHDLLYLKENRYKKPKEIFKFVLKLVKKINRNLNKKVIVDFGCAAGEFLFFLKSRINYNCKLIGFDHNNSLIQKAKNKVKNIIFLKKNILKLDKKYKNFSDISICIGVISIFDDFYKVINNLIFFTKKGIDQEGFIILHFLSNDFNFDVNIKYSSSISKKNFFHNKYSDKNRIFQSGWNVLSKTTISNFLEYHPKVKKFTFHDFKINKNIRGNKEDPIRSWTIKYNNRIRITNGLGFIQNHCFVIIEL